MPVAPCATGVRRGPGGRASTSRSPRSSRASPMPPYRRPWRSNRRRPPSSRRSLTPWLSGMSRSSMHRGRIDQDRAYAEAMRQVYEKYPNDLDAGTLYADALFLLEPRPGPPPGRRPRLTNLDAPNTRRIHEVPGSAARPGPETSRGLPLVRPRDRGDAESRPGTSVCRVPRQEHSGRQPHQSHAVAHVQRGRALG